jgi:vancomycin resistance protein VanW
MPGPDRILRRVAGPAVRRARREWQWRRCGADLGLSVEPEDRFAYLVASHQTPVMRPLAGVEQRLQRNKEVNLRLAAARLDGLVLRPGQRLSFWRRVGKPTARRGFLDGLVLDHGHLTEGVGGGLCQLTNLLYWMTLHTSLTVVERWRHTYDVFPDAGRTQPFGTGATCAYPSLDLQIENRTLVGHRLAIAVTGPDLVGAWRAEQPPRVGYEIYETHHQMTNEAPGVFIRHNVIRRRVRTTQGELVDDELVAVNHALMMYPPFLEAGRP